MAAPAGWHTLQCHACYADIEIEVSFTVYSCDCTDRKSHAHVAVTHNAESVIQEHYKVCEDNV